MEHASVDNFQNGILGIIIVLLVACLLLIVSKKIRWVPYTALLVVVGVFVNPGSFLPLDVLRLTPSMVLFFVLPVLLFESAFNFEFREFKKVLSLSFLLATVGLIISTLIIAVILHFVTGVEFISAVMFSAVISSTDPIAVLTIFKELGVPKKLQLLVDGESFLNDGTSVIIFKILSRFVTGATLIGTESSEILISGLWNFVVVLLGGAIIGVLMGWIFAQIISSVKNISIVEFLLTWVLATAVFMIAEHYLHVSGIIAVLFAGLTMGNYGRSKISPRAIHEIHNTWNLLVFIISSFVFLLIGYEIHVNKLAQNIGHIVLAIVAMLVGRSIAVYLLGPIYNKFVAASKKIPFSWLHVVNIGGLRGSLPLVIFLSLPDHYQYKELFLDMTLGAILFSLIFNSSIIKSIILKLNIDKPSKTNQIETKIVEILIFEKVIHEMKKLNELGEICDETFLRHQKSITASLQKTSHALEELVSHNTQNIFDTESARVLDRYCLNIEKSSYYSLYSKNVIEEGVYLQLESSISDQIEQLDECKQQFNILGEKVLSPGAQLNKVYEDKMSLINILINLKGRKVTDQIEDIYLYHKSRYVGDKKVLEELERLKKIKVEIFSQKIIEAKIQQYQEILAHNIKTLKYIEGIFPEIVVNAEEIIFENESDDVLYKTIKELGEEGRVSLKALQSLDLKI